MIVCHCRVVPDRTVRAAIADGCRTVEEIARRCGAGADCRACHPLLEELLDDDGLVAVARVGSARLRGRSDDGR